MRKWLYIFAMVVLWLPTAAAKELPCDAESYPEICSFLQRYITEISHWDNPNLLLQQKLRDDKFLILDGDLSGIEQMDSTTAFSLTRYDNKAYEALWTNGNEVLLRVAFPIQYELILGQSQYELEPQLQQFIQDAAGNVMEWTMPQLKSSPDEEGIFHSMPNQHYQVQSLTNEMYFYQSDSCLLPVMDSLHADYSLSNLFLMPVEGFNPCMQVQQNIYGFSKLHYTITLRQWLLYCQAEHMTCYVAIEEETAEAWKVLIIAENIDLAYNHVVSVWVPKSIFKNQQTPLLVKINAFVPTHNVKDLYEQYREKTKKNQYYE